MANFPILSLVGVSKQFSRHCLPAVSDVSFSLRQGDILGLLGPSGCGKTTLLRMIAGFDQPDQGVVEIADRVVANPNHCLPPEQRNIGMVFQDYALFPHLTVEKNIAFGLQQVKKISSRQIQLRVQEVLELVHLKGLELRYIHELSGGQQQRVALARALAPCPAIVLLDEPLSNLDVQVRLQLRQELREILKASETSAIFVTHDQEEALCISDQVAVMQQGCLQQLGTPEEIYQSPASKFVAEFVTQANFIPARRQGQVWQTEIGTFNIEPHLDPLNTGCSGEGGFDQVELMLRQEDCQLQPDESGAAVIKDRQFLGREHHYCLQTHSGQQLGVRMQVGQPLAIGTRVNISVPSSAIRVFPTQRSPLPGVVRSMASVG
ncbi:MAG: ABC transporter ATP-binding protein [Microcoleaceae cyanobacterium]